MQFASRSLLALIVFLAISWQIKPVHCVLTSAEINALAQILEAFPDLRSVAVWRQYPDSSTAMDYGGSWTNDINLLCNGNDGYTFYGVHCTNGHVSALMMYAAPWCHFKTNKGYYITSARTNDTHIPAPIRGVPLYQTISIKSPA